MSEWMAGHPELALGAMVAIILWAISVGDTLSRLILPLQVPSEPQKPEPPEVRPFQSYEEYRAAFLEMDLGEFLDRAFLTSESIKKRKPPVEISFAASGQDGNLYHMSAGGQGYDACGGVSKQHQEQLGLMKAMHLDVETSVNRDWGCAPFDPLDIRKGMWLRHQTTKELAVITEEGMYGTARVQHRKSAPVWIYVSDYGVAWPVKGECWEIRACIKHRRDVTYPAKFECDVSQHHVFVRCGCVKPVNWGNG